MIECIQLDDGCIWEGRIENGKRNGSGIKYYANGATYEGFWKDDVRHGPGIKTHANGKKVEVYYVEGEKVIFPH